MGIYLNSINISLKCPCKKHKLHDIVYPCIIPEKFFSVNKDKDKDNNPFIGPQEFVVGYSKAPEQPQSSAWPIYMSFSHYDEDGREPATISIAAYWSSPPYALRHGI